MRGSATDPRPTPGPRPTPHRGRAHGTAGALAYAALKNHSTAWQGKRVACILSGANASMHILREALS